MVEGGILPIGHIFVTGKTVLTTNRKMGGREGIIGPAIGVATVT